jgi:hypothetical protein
MAPEAALDVLEERNVFTPARIRAPDRPVHHYSVYAILAANIAVVKEVIGFKVLVNEEVQTVVSEQIISATAVH